MACKYIYNNKLYSFEALLEELSSVPLDKSLAILYSLQVDRLATIYDKIQELKKEYKLKANVASSDAAFNFDEDGDIKPTSGFTTLTFIDSAYFDLDGDRPGFRLNVEEYLSLQKELYKQLGLSEDDAKFKCELIRSKWDKIAKDATDLHRIIVSSNSNSDDRHYSGASLNTSFLGIYTLLGDIVKQILKDIWKKNSGSELITNVGIEAKLRNIAESIIGHIDYLFIRPNGDIEIYNLKVSKDYELEWSEAKKDKYKYLLAFLKRMLEYNGIDAKNIRVNLIPVKLEYDDTFDNVIGISAQAPKAYDSNGTRYTMQLYDNIVAHYMDSNVTLEDVRDDIFDEVNAQLRKIFAGRDVDIYSEGVKESAKGWTKKHWNRIARQAVGKKGWEILLPGDKKPIYVEETAIGDKNQTVVNMVADREEELFGNTARQKGIYRIVSDILKSYSDRLDFCGLSSKDTASGVIERQLTKYFNEYDGLDEDGKVKNYNWKLIENDTLFNANILMFKNVLTDQLDIITFTPFDVSLTAKAKGRNNLLGQYLADLNNYNFNMESNYGNIEAIRTMLLLNAIVPLLGNPKLGLLKIIGLSPFHKKSGKEYVISQLLPQFDTIVNVVKSNNLSLNFINNFKTNSITAVDPALIVILTWREAITNYPQHTRDLKTLEKYITSHTVIDGTKIDGLESAKTVEAKLFKLNSILEMIKDIDPVVAQASPKELIEHCGSSRTDRKWAARVYAATLRAISMYNGDLSIDNEEFSSIDEYFFKPQIIPNTSVRTVGYMFLRSIDTISKNMLDRYSPIRSRIMKYFEDKGYTALQNSTIGNHSALFANLYLRDLEGNLTMQFKNPYDPSADLTNLDRDFLKDMLFELNKIRYEMKGLTWAYSGVNDLNLINAVNTNSDSSYLNVPLMRASKATRNENVAQGIKDFGRRWMKRIMHPKEAFKEFAEDIVNEDEKQQRDDDIKRLLAYNPFLRSETTNGLREDYIKEKGVDYFETDLETLMVNFMEKHVQSVEFNKMLTRTKGILLDLQLRGIAEDDPKGVEHTVKTINDYLQVSVFNKSIMEEESLAIESFLDPIRKGVSKCYIAANPTAFVRDITEGLLQNMTKAITKFQTDINASDVAHGYKEVVMEGPGNLMKITKLNQLNLKYRFSNLDIARISEGLKTSGSGVLNASNWAYQTLRTPDYLNRMVLFSAKMHHDGTEDAYYIKDGELIYDWTKDKRFKNYRNNNYGEDFNKERSLYLSLLRAFNLENGTSLQEGDALPDAYTSLQIAQFKNFADNIYGSYNQSTRAKYENVALGRNFGVFSTWMNGIVDVYAKKRQISNSESEWKLETDDSGNLLFFDKNGNVVSRKPDANGEPITQDGDVPVMKDIPLMVLGVIYTLKDLGKELWFNGWDAVKKDVLSNEVNRRNLRRLLSDMIMWMLLGAIFTCVIGPAYADHKKNARGQDIIQNGLIELTYNATHNAYDGFKGPFAVLDYIGNSTNPATYKLPTKIFNDLGSFIMGDKTFGGLLMGSQALPRSFRDTYRMWVRDTQN